MSSTYHQPTFALTNGLSTGVWQTCLKTIKDRFPGYTTEEALSQGGCSHTFIVKPRNTSHLSASPSGEIFVVQLRPEKHAISPSIAGDARGWYGELAPEFEELGRLECRDHAERLQICRMSLLPGLRLSDLLGVSEGFDKRDKLTLLLKSLAEFYARAWHRGILRSDNQLGEAQCTGRVGATMLQRLQWLGKGLPTRSLRSMARSCRARMQRGALDILPIVLTHGDLIPSNIMVDPATWRLGGLMDWAEAEYLPFGMSLYCVDRVLAEVDRQGGFRWYDDADELKREFWTELRKLIPSLQDQDVRDAVNLSRDIGVLLWHGIAWDGGSIDRVVEPGRDDEEVAYLTAFLEVGSRTPHALL